MAVDGSDIPTWGTDHNYFEIVTRELGPNRREVVTDDEGNITYNKVRVVTDDDAGWRGSDNPDKKAAHFGYSLSVAVSVREDDGPSAPLAALATRLRPVNFLERTAGLACVAEVAAKRGRLGDVLVDKGYTPSKTGADFLLPVRALGGEPVFDLTTYQVGPSGTLRGALIIDGRPYSPSLPRALRHLTPPRGGEDGTYKPDPAKVREYRERIAARAAYALEPHGVPRANGVQLFTCPGALGKLDCPLRPPERGLRPKALVVLNAPAQPGPKSVCVHARTSLSLEDLPLYQRHVYGSWEWARSYSRRSTSVETYFGLLKSATGGGVERGQIRVSGIVKTGLLLAFAMSSTNRNCALSFSASTSTSAQPKRVGRPRSHSLTRYREVAMKAKNHANRAGEKGRVVATT